MATKHLKGFSIERYDVYDAKNTTFILDEGAEYIGASVQGIFEADQAKNNTYILKGTLRGGHAIETLGMGTTVSVSRSGDLYGANSAIRMEGEDVSVTNRGHLTAGGWAIEVASTAYDIHNYGFIAGDVGVRSYHGGTIVNDGKILSSSAGINALSQSGEVLEIVNHGMISGKRSIDTFEGNDHITNTGMLKGYVELGAGNDVFDNRRGTLKGAVEGGLGEDIYIVSNSKTEIIEASGGGTDAVKSSINFALAEYIEQLYLIGSRDAHGTGNDIANVIKGNAGDNLLSGLGGVDQIYGGAGNDTLVGGDQSDFFYFNTGYGRDTVADFIVGEDQIVLSGLDGIDDFQDLITNHITQKGENVVIKAGADMLILSHTNAGDLSDADFQF
jgi:Ca2+-binding RTX toxin-like protein